MTWPVDARALGESIQEACASRAQAVVYAVVGPSNPPGAASQPTDHHGDSPSE